MTASPEPLTDARSSASARMPDFFIVGHAKSGTTALYEMLRRHPQVFMPTLKEPQFFARHPDPAAVAGTFAQTGRNAESVEQYLSLFAAARPDQLVGEASTFYLWSQRAPERIAAANPQARIIAILREPASFLHSLHLQMLQNNSETERDLRRALALEEARRQGHAIPPHSFWPEALMYSQRVRYVEQLRRYEHLFGRERVLALIYDDFRADNEGTLRRVLRFLGLDEDAIAAPAVEANPTVAVRSVRLHTLIKDVRRGRSPLGRAVRAVFIAATTPALRARYVHPLRQRLQFRAAPPPADERLLAELRVRFKDEVVALGEHLGRDLVREWGYDSVA